MTAVSRGIDRIEVTFDDPSLVANAGLLLVATLVVPWGWRATVMVTTAGCTLATGELAFVVDGRPVAGLRTGHGGGERVERGCGTAPLISAPVRIRCKPSTQEP